ncbi:MAG: tolC 2 [Firmicutes bacterium]|nr:tolC 2 [Bacillota bacterium]
MKFCPYVSRLIMTVAFLVLLGQSVLAAPVELSLENCISLALKNNSNIKAAEADKEKYLWAVNEAKGNNGLTLNYVNNDYRKRTAATYADSASKPPYDLITNQIAFSLPLYSGGKNESLVDQAKLNYTVATLNLAAVKQQSKFDATSTYYQVLQYRNLVAADQKSVEDYSLQLKNLQNKYDAGSASKLQVLQTQVSLANAEGTLTKDQNSYQIAVINLNKVVGLPRGSEVILQENLAYEKNSLTLEACLNYALKNRPEIAMNKANLAIAEENIKIANSGNLPTVSLNGYNAWQSRHFPGTEFNYYSYYLTVSFNLFDSGITKSKLKEATAALNKAQEIAKQAGDTIYANVSQYYLSMREAEKRIDTSRVAVTEAEEAHNIAQIRFDAGLGTNQEILDSEVALITARNNYIQALYDYNTNQAGLAAAMGVTVNE